MSEPIAQLEALLARLPGLGRRSAQRIALAIARNPERYAEPLMEALQNVRESICTCSLCGGFTTRDADPCHLCDDPKRDRRTLCVVEDPADIPSLEASGGYRGLYHALMGRISPAKHLAPEDLRIAALLERLETGEVEEVLLALGTDMEGDATAHYLAELLLPLGVRVTRLAYGLPADSGIGYSDPLTLRRAIAGRQPLGD